MNCEKIRERTADYLAGELDEESLAGMRAHLAECPHCREELEGNDHGREPHEEPEEQAGVMFSATGGKCRRGTTEGKHKSFAD